MQECLLQIDIGGATPSMNIKLHSEHYLPQKYS